MEDVLSWVTMASGVVGMVAGCAGMVVGFRASRRAERLERLSRVRFEFRSLAGGRFGLVNVGTDVARDVRIDAASVVGVAVDRGTIIGKCAPGRVWPYRFTPGEDGAVPDSIRVTWTQPFSGQQYVLLPRAGSPRTGHD